jgi:hypothetical protein
MINKDGGCHRYYIEREQKMLEEGKQGHECNHPNREMLRNEIV